jgi:hypothetical protein
VLDRSAADGLRDLLRRIRDVLIRLHFAFERTDEDPITVGIMLSFTKSYVPAALQRA